MFAIGFDLLWNQTKLTHPKGLSQAYAEIGAVLNRWLSAHSRQRLCVDER